MAGFYASDNELDALVEFWWLPANRPYAINHVSKEDGEYKYQSTVFKPLGPFHPVMGKGAAIGISRSGIIRLWYVEASGKYQECASELENLGIMDDTFTHASISWNNGKNVLLATYTASKQLRLYRISIDWGVPIPSSTDKAPPVFPTAPKIHVERIRDLHHIKPLHSSIGNTEPQLSHIAVLGPAPQISANMPMVPTVMCVFSGKNDNQEYYTAIARWDLKNVTESIHPSFEQLQRQGNSSRDKKDQQLDLFRLDDLQIEKCCVGVSLVTSGAVVALTFSDGSAEFRDRATMVLHEPNPADGKISNMVQVGFSFPKIDACIGMVLSPNNTVAARLGVDNDVKIAITELITGSIEDPAFHAMFLSEIHRVVNLKLDFSVDPPSEKLIRNALLQRCLSMQYSLDFHGNAQAKTLSAKLAWTTLHLRLASLASGLTSVPPPGARQRQGPGGPQLDDNFRADAMQSLLGLVRWFSDIMTFLVSDLLELSAMTEPHPNSLPTIKAKAHAINSPALFLVLCSAPRAFLRYICKTLKILQSNSERLVQSNKADEDAIMTIKSFSAPLQAGPIQIHQFERVMASIDSSVKSAYGDAPDTVRTAMERSLFVHNDIPEMFNDTVNTLLGQTLPELRKEIKNISALFWADLSWLGLHDDPSTLNYGTKHVIDALRKTEIPRTGVRVRRCTRCCAVSEEMPVKPVTPIPPWLPSMQRMCLCGTLWMQESPGVAP
ncbi:hypothetical protein EX30DRAFT_372724 [Ascodesmis nigricans]|uniref:Mediator of RNA polymerase II transcription subunit 16 n=1 Tax=Ascodesmis nigricans TaxID=341454 RepID=A0A4S2MT86_9PEZI|nr:hypothetical protein EX30DRAFT_372724 [Ascodesmis nigricans]